MIAIQRIAASGKVVVVPFRRQHVIVLVVDAAKRDHRPTMITLGGVVEHDIQDDLNTRPVQLLDQVLDLVHLHAEAARRGITRFGSKEAQRAVAPVVQQQLTRFRMLAAVFPLVKFENRQQFDAIDAELLQIRNLLPNTGIGSGRLSLSEDGCAVKPRTWSS